MTAVRKNGFEWALAADRALLAHVELLVVAGLHSRHSSRGLWRGRFRRSFLEVAPARVRVDLEDVEVLLELGERPCGRGELRDPYPEDTKRATRAPDSVLSV